MAKCLLHVGMHKTGSTSIQNSLKGLDDENFYYARLLGRPNHSLSLPSVFAQENDKRLIRKRFAHDEKDLEERSGQAREDLNSSIEAAHGRTLVISGEGILRMSTKDLVKLKNYLARRGYDDISVMAYIRPPFGYISSAVQQKIKTGSSKVLKISSSAPDYQKKFAKFDEVFGADRVSLFKFEPDALVGKDVVVDFCGRAGIPLASIALVRKNESIPRLAAQLRFQYTAYAEDEGLRPLRAGAGAALCHELRDLDQTRFRMAPSVLKPFIDSLKPDIEWMEKRLGQTLDEDLNDSELDIHSEADLLQPIPGIQEKLRSLLIKDGEQVPGEVADNTWKLLHLIASTAKKRRDAEEESGEGGLDLIAQRVARKLARQARKGGAGGTAEQKTERQARRAARQEGQDISGRAEQRGVGRSGGANQEKQARHHIQNAGTGKNNGSRQEKRRARGEGAGMAGDKGQRLRWRQEQIAIKLAALETGEKKASRSSVFEIAEPDSSRRKVAARQGQRGAFRRHDTAADAAPQNARLMKAFREIAKKGEGRNIPHTPISMAPKPLLNKDKNLIVVWSPKSACTTAYVWFSHISGFASDVKNYASWPHRHRIEKYLKSDLYADSATSGMAQAKMLRIIRDPYGRAVSIYRHALQTHFADKEMDLYSQGSISAEKGYSFQTFLDLLLQLDMRRADIHFRPQFHSFERTRMADRVINITKQDLFTGLNEFEAEVGFAKTNFEDLNWLHSLESKRRAKQERIEGEGLDIVHYSRNQVAKLGIFPNYEQLLTPEARQKIEIIYKSDFDAYRDYL